MMHIYGSILFVNTNNKVKKSEKWFLIKSLLLLFTVFWQNPKKLRNEIFF